MRERCNPKVSHGQSPIKADCQLPIADSKEAHCLLPARLRRPGQYKGPRLNRQSAVGNRQGNHFAQVGTWTIQELPTRDGV